MKAIMISIRPQWVAKILNGEKTLEIRKRFPKDYVGWVYIYCTKGGALLFKEYNTNTYLVEEENKTYRPHYALNGKVVARFWCDKVETFRCNITGNLKDGFFKAKPYCKVIEDGIANYNCDDEFEEILKNAQLTNKELAQFLGDKECPYGGWYVFNAIHITKLEIFDKPRELSEFKRYSAKSYPLSALPKTKEKYKEFNSIEDFNKYVLRVMKAPQSFCYIEI